MEEGGGLRDQYLLVLTPFLGSALAITYNVGYFFGIGGRLQFFTFFSLSEHIVFARAVFPQCLLAAIVYGAIVFYMHKLLRMRPLILVFLMLLSTAAVIWLVGVVAQLTFFAAALVMFGFFTALAIWRETFWERVAFACAAAVIIAPLLGFTVADETIRPHKAGKLLALTTTTTLETKDQTKLDVKLGATLEGIVLASGERGVVFLEKGTQDVTLLPWDEISRVTIGPPKPSSRAR
jgi:hypothetical protein